MQGDNATNLDRKSGIWEMMVCFHCFLRRTHRTDLSEELPRFPSFLSPIFSSQVSWCEGHPSGGARVECQKYA